MEQDADNTQTVTDVEPCALPTSTVCHEKLEQSREDGGSLKDLLQGAENIVYEARDDATNISFVMNGRRKWVPVVVTKLRGGEMNAAKWINVRELFILRRRTAPTFRSGKESCSFQDP